MIGAHNMKLLQDYQLLHQQDCFAGNSVMNYTTQIAQLMYSYRPKSFIDYGCGRASPYFGHEIHQALKLDYEPVCLLYDPAVAAISEKPTDPVGAIICCDVLEHIPEEELDEILTHIYSLARVFVFFAIALVPDGNRKLLDGSDVHVTLKTKEAWLNLIHKYSTVPTYIAWSPPGLDVV